jgi:hypothetical protein
MKNRVDSDTTAFLRDLYRLGRINESLATPLFQDLLRNGYKQSTHREVLAQTRAFKQS